MNFFVKNFGCKVNQFESEYFINKLIEKNFVYTDNLDCVDILIINSCAVTKEAERQLLQYIRKIKRLYPDKKIILTGCAVDNRFDKFSNNSLITSVASNYFKKELPNLIYTQKKFKKFKTIFKEQNFNDLNFYDTFSHTRKFLKIQDGCSNYCSYCIIPFVRGKPRSLSFQNVLNKIEIISKNFREVVLTGINIGIYGKDLGYKNGLLDLLQIIEKYLLKNKIEDFRIRITSLKPDEISNDFISFAKNSKYLCPHFHLSLQNLNNKILKLMNRKYTFELIEKVVNSIRDTIPNAGIGCDLITGFPEETEKEFLDNIDKLEKLDINFFHIFPFSKREKTKAFFLKENADKREKKRRVAILKKIGEFKTENFIKKNIHNTFKVIFEKEINGYLSGYSENYIKILIKNEKIFNLKNKIVSVKGEGIKNKFFIIGRLQ